MLIRQYLVSIIATAAVALVSVQPLCYGQETEADWRRMRSASEAEQTVWINSHLRAGMPPSEVFGDLMLNKSEVTLPLMEKKIEEVLRSPSPLECFTNKSVNPQGFIDAAALAITEVGNVQSLKEASKLIKIDEKRFGSMVEGTMRYSSAYRNPFTLASRGLELGDPALDSRIAKWVQGRLAEEPPPPNVPGAAEGAAAVIREVRGWLAEALVERYGAVPTEKQWFADPLVFRLAPPQAAWMHDDVMRIASEGARKRSKY